MNADSRRLLHELGSEIAALLRSHGSRSPEQREAAARRWAALKERAETSPGDDFRLELHGILSRAVGRLEGLHDEVLRADDQPDRDAPR